LIKPVSRLISLAMAVTLVSAGPLGAQTGNKSSDAPPPPPRRLTGEAASKRDELWQQIHALQKSGRFGEAIAPASEILKIRTRLQGEGHWETVGSRYLLDELKQLASLPQEGQRAIGLTWSEPSRAIELEGKGAYAEAEKIHRTMIETLRRWLGDDHPDLWAVHYNNLAGNLDDQGRYAEALPLHRKALDLSRKASGDNHPDTATYYGNFANHMRRRGWYADAQPLLEKALDIRRKALGEVDLDTAAAYTSLAANLDDQGRFAEVQPLYKKALDIQLQVLGEDHPVTAQTYICLAIHLDGQGRFADAQALIQKALDTLLKVLGENDLDTALAYNKLAVTLEHQGRYADAAAWNEKALDVRRKVLGEEHPLTAHDYYSLGRNLDDQGRHADALPLHQRALDIRRKGEAPLSTALSYLGVAGNLQAQGRNADALPLFQRALDIYREVLGEDHPATTTAYNNLANNLHDQGRYADAVSLNKKVLDVRRKRWGEDHFYTAISYHNLAVNLQRQKRYADALPLYERALAILRKVRGELHPGTANAYHSLAVTLEAQGRAAEALPLYRNALDIRRKALGENHAHVVYSYSGVASSLQALGRIPEAITYWTAAAEGFERSRRALSSSGLGRSQAVFYDPLPRLAGVLAAQGQAREAWRWWESSLGRGLLDDLSARQLRPLTPVQRDQEANLQGEIQRLDERIGELAGRMSLSEQGNGSLDDLREQWNNLCRQRDTLRGQLIEFGQAIEAQYGAFGGKIASLQEIQAVLPPDTALVGWVDVKRTGSVSLHWACLLGARGDPVWVKVPGSGPDGEWTERDDRRLDDLRRALLAKDSVWRESAAQIARQRLAPLKPQLDGLRRLIVLPSPELAGIPVEVMLGAWTDGPPLVVSYAPSGTLFAKLANASERRPRATGLLAVGDPLYDQSATARLPRLPGTRREVQAIAALFPTGEVTTLLGAQATETAVQRLATSGELARSHFLHFATHGTVNPDVAMSSALILGPDGEGPPSPGSSAAKSDGWITAEQILNTWNLDADLVVFSACETGLGKKAGGEGYLGFAQALFIKGARSLVLSQWSVSDAATALLMARFYRNLLGQRPGISRPMSKAEALDEAKRWLRGLTKEEVINELEAIQERGKVRPMGPPAGSASAPPSPPPAPTNPRPFEHPQFWAAFILIGDPS
jgi:CHAT domain-containing protein/tetratricopeptide (TPR) repeat protein